MNHKHLLPCLCAVLVFITSCKQTPPMCGVVLSVSDLESADWVQIALDNGINTIGTHISPEQVYAFISSEKGQAFTKACEENGIYLEHQLHAIHDLLGRELFDEHPEYFRMDENGNRTPDANCCPSCPEAIELIASRAAQYAKLLPSTNHRYYYWLDDAAPTCLCPLCKDLSASDQAMLIENAMIREIRKVDPKAMLAHLAYHNTILPPSVVKPEEGIFLEFAPFYRTWDSPLANPDAIGRTGEAHATTMQYLLANLEVFPAETAVVLEYWLDVSLFSGWQKPAVELIFDEEVYKQDLKTYANLGLHNITSFAVYMDEEYFARFPQTYDYLHQYGNARK